MNFIGKNDFGSLFKDNFEKTYDDINWIFVQNHEVERFFCRHDHECHDIQKGLWQSKQ
jgi:hypothetical protein